MAQVRVRWIDSVSVAAAGNKIYRDDVEIADIGMGVQEYVDTVAPDDSTPKYEVQAHDGAGDETTQEVEGVNVDYISTIPVPDAPTGLAAGTPTQNTIPLTWTKSATGVMVEYRVYIGGSLQQTFGDVAAGTLTGLTAETTYSNITVAAWDGSQESPYSNSINVTTEAVPVAPDAPTNLVAGTPTETTIPLTWTKSATGVMTEYRAYIDGSLAETFGDVAAGTLTGLTADTTYNNITVRAFDGLESADSNAVSGTTEAAPVSSVPIVEQFTFEMDTTPADQIVLTKPAGTINNGDLLMMIVGNEDDTNAISGNPVAGWTKEFEHGDAGQDVKVMLYWRIADGTEGATETVTFATGINALFGWYLHVSGAHATAPIGIEGVLEKAASAVITTQSITTTINNSLVFSLFGFDSAHGSISVTSGVGWPTDFPANQYIWSGGGTGDIEGGFLTKDMNAAGATNDVVYTSTIINGHVGLQFEILSLTP